MFIVWGTKVVRRVVGRRADYCQLCQGFQPATLIRVKLVNHVYYIPVNAGSLIGLEQTCETCGLRLEANDLGEYPQVSHDRHADVETLLEDTNPGARHRWAAHIAWDDALRAGTVTPANRAQTMTDTFVLANYLVEARTAHWNFDKLSSAACVLTLTCLLGGLWLGDSMGDRREDFKSTVVALTVGLALLTIVLFLRDGHRYTRRAVLPVLARALRPLKPTEEELSRLLQNLKSREMKIGKYLDAHQILEAMVQFD